MLKYLGVSRSGYRAFLNHKPSASDKRRVAVKNQIQQIYDDSHQNYGAPKITAELRKSGEVIAERIKEAFTDQVLPDIAPLSLPVTNPVNITADCTNRAIHANSFNSMHAINISINGINISLDANVPETFLCSLIKAVRYA